MKPSAIQVSNAIFKFYGDQVSCAFLAAYIEAIEGGLTPGQITNAIEQAKRNTAANTGFDLQSF